MRREINRDGSLNLRLRRFAILPLPVEIACLQRNRRAGMILIIFSFQGISCPVFVIIPLMDTLKVKRLNPSAHLPEKARAGDLGFDLFAAERVVIPSGEMKAVGTGIAVEFPKGWGGVVKDRSSMALKRLTISAGVIDNGYRGEIKILITNHSRTEHTIEPNQKIAQLIPCPVTDWRVETAEELDDSHRGEGGFGSTGAFKSPL